MKRITITFLATLASSLVNAAEYPNLDTIEIGKAFPHPRADAFPDLNRPTTQYKVPNYGSTKDIFSEYQVVILNEVKKVVIVSAEASFATDKACEDNKKKLKSIIQARFPGFNEREGKELNLRGIRSAYVKDDVNTFYTLNCMRKYGPFAILDYHIRGKKEDKELNAAWKTFFSKKR